MNKRLFSLVVGIGALLLLGAASSYDSLIINGLTWTGSTGTGYVLTDVAGNGQLSMAAASGGGTTNFGPASFFTIVSSNFIVSLGSNVLSGTTWETNATGTNFHNGNSDTWIYNGSVASVSNGVFNGNGGGLSNIFNNNGPPTIATNAAGHLGGGGTAVFSTVNKPRTKDLSFEVTVNSGTSVAAGVWFTVTYAKALLAPGDVIITPGSATAYVMWTSTGKFCITNNTVNGFDFWNGGASSSQVNMVFDFTVIPMGQ